MGILDSIFGGSSKNVSSSGSTNVPKWVDQGGQDLFNAAESAGSRPYPTYGGERIAPFNSDQQAAFDTTRENVGSWAPLFEQSAKYGASGASPVTAGDINTYMDPYVEDVVNRSTAQIARQAGQQRIADNAAMAKRGSFLNESRRAVIDNMRADTTQRAIGDTAAQGYSAAYQSALGQANKTKQQQTDASKLFSDLAAGRVQLGNLDANQLMTIGNTIQALHQQGDTTAYQDFLNEFYYPQDQLSYMQSMLQGIPTSRTTTSTYPVAGNNIFGQVAGAGMTIAGGLHDFGVF